MIGYPLIAPCARSEAKVVSRGAIAFARAATVAVDVPRSDSCCCSWLRAATVAVAVAVACEVAVAVAVAVAVSPR